MKIYSDKKFLKGTCHILVPFWGDNLDPSDSDANRFDKYCEECIYELTDLEEADFCVYPGSPKNPQFRMFCDLTYPKKVVVFFNSDDDGHIDYNPNVICFRTSFYKSTKQDCEFALPAWSKDWGQLEMRDYDEPVVGFCGQSIYPKLRSHALLKLERSSIKTNFIKRNAFWAGAKNCAMRQQVRRQYIDNMSDCDYVLCIRGVGNFSYRIYEAMMSGRIPVLINTDCVLPFEEVWAKDIIITNITNMENDILEYHSKIKDYKALQNKMRFYWEEYLSPEGFLNKVGDFV